MTLITKLATVCSFACILASCSKENSMSKSQNDMSSAKASAEVAALSAKPPKGTEFLALTNSNEIVRYSSGNPLQEISTVMVSGTMAGERIIGIDFRPVTGQLYGVSNQSRLYVINYSSGIATAVSSTPFTPAINGTQVGFDFNPTVDRIRLVTNTGQNLRLNPVTGTVAATDISITMMGAQVTGVAYTNSVAGATSTTLYDIDAATDKLYKQMPPNNGVLVEVGSLGVQVVGDAGFDISPDNSVAIAAIFGRGYEAGQMEMSEGNKYRFYYINLETGAATNAGKTDREVIGVAILP